MALWAAGFLVSMTWLYSVHVYRYANHWGTALLAIAGIAMFAAALRKRVDLSAASPWWGVLAAPLLVACIILPAPYCCGPVLLLLGVLLMLACRLVRASALAAALLVSGVILTLQSAVYPVYVNYAAKDPHVPFLSAFIYPILKFLGLRTSLSDGTVFIQTMRDHWPFPTAWGSLGLFPLLQLCVAAAVLLAIFGGPPAKGLRALWMFLIGIGYMIARYVVMLLLFIYLMYYVGYFEEKVWMGIFWNRALTLVTFVPLLLIFAKAFPLRRTGERIAEGLRLEALGSDLLKRKAAAIACAVAGAFLFIGYVGYWSPGTVKKGRVLLDERHSDWEKSNRRYDTSWYGNESGYNYWSLSDLLSYYYTIDKNDDRYDEAGEKIVAYTTRPLTMDYLQDYDVLLLKNPTYPYTQEEVDDIVKWVEQGGGLFLMGEHTNVFGSSVPLNTLGRRFGFYFRYDSVFDIEEKFEQLWHVPRYLACPVVQNQRNFLFATSCSIQPLHYLRRTRNAVVAGGLWSLPIEYASGNFYPQVKTRTDMTYGPLVQMITATRGKGRVIGFSDSTTFSNFSSQLPGKPEMLLSSMSWLNRRNGFDLNSAFLVVSLLLFGAGIAVTVGTPRHLGTKLAAISAGVCAVALAMVFFTSLTKSSYPLPQPERHVPKVVFEKQYSQYEIPVSGFVKEQKESFAIFYQWVLRLQYFPFLKYTFDEALAERPDVLVIINPTNVMPPGRTFTVDSDFVDVQERVIPKLKDYLAAGGRVLLMDDVTNEKSMANLLLEPFGVRLDRAPHVAMRAQQGQQQPPMKMAVNGAGNVVCSVPEGLSIFGGESLLTIAAGPNETRQVILARKKVGQGMLLVMSTSKRFCDMRMGYSQSGTPNADALQASWLEYAMIRGQMNSTVSKDALTEEIQKLGTRLATAPAAGAAAGGLE